MDYLDYVQMTKGQRAAYKIKSFFTGIPGAIGNLFRIIAYYIKKFFVFVGTGIKNYAQRFAQGDIGTKLSFIIMGAGNVFHKQIGKGIRHQS